MAVTEQGPWRVRVETGAQGADAVVDRRGYAVVVDVLSFSTTVSVAMDRGIEAYPYRWSDPSVAAFGRDRRLRIAAHRTTAAGNRREVSLSPAHMRQTEDTTAVVLPSPNGSTVAARLANRGATVLTGCLRDAAAVAAWLTARRHDPGSDGPVCVVAAGERWPDGSLRPALEDVLGAGAVVAALGAQGIEDTELSPEARAARAVWRDARIDIAEVLRRCVSGRELIERGFGDDVEIAAEVDATDHVAVLTEGRFVASRRP